MKLLSSSFSSSSSSTASLNVNMCNSKSATAGCLAGILRRILCSGTLPTHPSDHITEDADSLMSLNVGEKNLSLETPGLVARLMGLESMPDVDFRCVKSRPNSVARSRSMNSTDRLAGYNCDDPKQQQQGLHRRAKSTTSFRETPEFVELGNEEFFILSFENVSKSKEFRPKERKCEVGCGELRQRRIKKAENRTEKTAAKTMIKKKDDQEGKGSVLSDLNGKVTHRRSCSDKCTNEDGNNVKVKDSTTSLVSTKQNVVASEAMKSRKYKKSEKILPSNRVKPNLNKNTTKKKTISQAVKQKECECTTEDSSPVSVLDCGQFLIDPQHSISEEDCGSTTTSSRRKLSLEIENYERQCPRRDHNLMSEGEQTEAKQGKYGKKLSDGQESSQVLDEIYRLSEAELFVSSNWVKRWNLNHDDFQCIGEELELQIFGQLLEEVVDHQS